MSSRLTRAIVALEASVQLAKTYSELVDASTSPNETVPLMLDLKDAVARALAAASDVQKLIP